MFIYGQGLVMGKNQLFHMIDSAINQKLQNNRKRLLMTYFVTTTAEKYFSSKMRYG